MQEMFIYDDNTQDISGWNVSNVTNMRSMFSGAQTGYTAANPLNLSSRDVTKVTNSTSITHNISPEGSIVTPNFSS